MPDKTVRIEQVLSQMQCWCHACHAYTTYGYVPASEDPVSGWKQDIRTQGGCRDSAADYRTTKCDVCGHVQTMDWATD